MFISLDSDEYITGVSGTQSSQVNSITFQSDKQSYGPYGDIASGTSFTTSFADGEALAYVFGSATDSQIMQLGFGSSLLCTGPSVSVIKEPSYGNKSGLIFDDMSHALLGRKITSITVCHGDLINGIAVQYGYERSNIETHGSTGVADEIESIFEIGDDENLVGINGSYSSSSLTSIQFALSSGKFSPLYGKPTATTFSISRSGYAISALHGQADELLHGIGAYTVGNAITEIMFTSISYSDADMVLADGEPFDAKSIIFDNSASSSAEKISQTTEIEVSSSTTVSSSFTISKTAKISYPKGFSFLKFSPNLNATIGDSFEESFTSDTVVNTEMVGFTFTAKVNANSKVKAIAVARNVSFSIPWTVTADIYYLGQSTPVETTIHGIYSGVRATAIGAEYEDLP